MFSIVGVLADGTSIVACMQMQCEELFDLLEQFFMLHLDVIKCTHGNIFKVLRTD